jgi:DNA polymerase-4
MPNLCRDCYTSPKGAAARCAICGSPRVISHGELWDLSIAHVDCDAFYASVEKRDNPDLRDKPVIIGGGKRGVVSTACYIARIKGVRSAMPMFKALKLCPEAVVLRGRMDVYASVSAQIKARMLDLTPAVEPLSLDEAFLDLTGTQRLHGAPPATLLARFAKTIAQDIGITISVGLSHNKFLAKIASDLDKPNGFAIIGQGDTQGFLADKPVGLLWGIGAVGRDTLEKAGIQTFADLRRWDRQDLRLRFGAMGERLYHLARGQDARPVKPTRAVKSISNETTFHDDITDIDMLDGHLWRLAEKVSDRAKAKGLAGRVVTLKLKQNNFKTLTRRVSLTEATQMADRIYTTARGLFDRMTHSRPYRLIGVGISDLMADTAADQGANLFDPQETKRIKAERARDAIRAKFGKDAIIKGRKLR